LWARLAQPGQAIIGACPGRGASCWQGVVGATGAIVVARLAGVRSRLPNLMLIPVELTHNLMTVAF